MFSSRSGGFLKSLNTNFLFTTYCLHACRCAMPWEGVLRTTAWRILALWLEVLIDCGNVIPTIHVYLSSKAIVLDNVEKKDKGTLWDASIKKKNKNKKTVCVELHFWTYLEQVKKTN